MKKTGKKLQNKFSQKPDFSSDLIVMLMVTLFTDGKSFRKDCKRSANYR